MFVHKYMEAYKNYKITVSFLDLVLTPICKPMDPKRIRSHQQSGWIIWVTKSLGAVAQVGNPQPSFIFRGEGYNL